MEDVLSSGKYNHLPHKDRMEMEIMELTFCLWASNLKTTALVFGPPGVADALDGPSEKFPAPKTHVLKATRPAPVAAGFLAFICITAVVCWILSTI